MRLLPIERVNISPTFAVECSLKGQAKTFSRIFSSVKDIFILLKGLVYHLVERAKSPFQRRKVNPPNPPTPQVKIISNKIKETFPDSSQRVPDNKPLTPPPPLQQNPNDVPPLPLRPLTPKTVDDQPPPPPPPPPPLPDRPKTDVKQPEPLDTSKIVNAKKEIQSLITKISPILTDQEKIFGEIKANIMPLAHQRYITFQKLYINLDEIGKNLLKQLENFEANDNLKTIKKNLTKMNGETNKAKIGLQPIVDNYYTGLATVGLRRNKAQSLQDGLAFCNKWRETMRSVLELSKT